MVAVRVVHALEPVEVDEQHGGVGVRTLRSLRGVLQPLLEQQPVGQTGQRIVQRAVPKLLRGRPAVFARLRVQQVGRGDVGQRLRGRHVVWSEVARRIAVEIERTEPSAAVAKGKREDGAETTRDRRRREPWEARVGSKVGYRDGLAAFVGPHAWSIAELGLQPLEQHRGLVGRRDVLRRVPGRDQRDAGCGDRQDLDDVPDQVVEDSLDRKVGRQRAREVAKNRGEFSLVDHEHSLGALQRKARE